MDRFVCIHGHFYQPPRESPWLEAIEIQDSAFPYHDWNERIAAECYAANAVSRLWDYGRTNRPTGEQLCQHKLQLRSDGLALDAEVCHRRL